MGMHHTSTQLKSPAGLGSCSWTSHTITNYQYHAQRVTQLHTLYIAEGEARTSQLKSRILTDTVPHSPHARLAPDRRHT